MVRIKYTGPMAQVQQVPVQTKTQAESEETTRLKTQEDLTVKQQQSLEMVQIMLHVSFGTLFYLREFLPLGCFDDRDLKQAQREQRYSYEEFIHGKKDSGQSESSQELGFGKGKRGQPLKIILRNSDPKADMILELLETGIFDALSRNVLEAIQLTILVDKDEPQNVLESYTFSFKYTGARGDTNSRLESLSLDPLGCVANMKSVQSARVGLEMIVRRIITLSAFLPTLPSNRHLGIHLFYTEDCPPTYEPPGFTKSSDEMIKYPLNEKWQRESQSCGMMDSGCHCVGLNVTSLKWNGPDPESSEALPKIPLQIEYNDKIERAAAIRLGEETSPASVSRDGTFQDATQDIAGKQKLQMMIPTQMSSYPDSDLVPTQPVNLEIDTEGTATQDTLGTPHKMHLSRKKALRIQEYLQMQIPGLAKKNADDQDSRIVKCQCGWDGEESAMITCSFCHARQHLLCYGFESSDDPRLPDTHACYQCLLEPDERQLLREMHTLVLLRRALKIILDEGFPNKTSTFTQKLHCNGQTVVQITDLLRKQRFLQSTPGSKSKGFVQKGLPKFVVPSAGDIRDRMYLEILNPRAKIYHHYTLQPAGPKVICAVDYQSSQEQGFSTERSDKGDRDTQRSNYGADKTFESPSRKRKQPGGNQDRSYCQDKLGQDAHGNTGSRSETFGRYTISNYQNQTNPQPATPSITRSPLEKNRLRRSNRKKRKISNYAQFIDVGAPSSGDESS